MDGALLLVMLPCNCVVLARREHYKLQLVFNINCDLYIPTLIDVVVRASITQ